MPTVTVDPFGPRLRALRESMGLSLRDLASRSGVSAPMLSQVERGETSPTLSVATRISSGLGLTLSQLLRLDEEPLVAVVRRGKGRRTRRDGHRFEELTPSVPGQPALVTVHTLDPGARTTGPPLHSAGSRETVVVQSGRVILHIADSRHHLGPGDSVTFDADLAHRLHNEGDAAAVFISVVSPGLRGA